MTSKEYAAQRYCDLMRQGFMKPLKPKRVKKVEAKPVTVACTGCLNWHRMNKHTADAAQRKINLAGAKIEQRVIGK